MFCKNCGAQIPDGSNVCPNCGQNANPDFQQRANETFNQAGQQLGAAFNDVRNNFNGGYQNGGMPSGGERLQSDRSLLMYILLTIVTCGIYSYYFIYKMAHDVNVACDGDGQSTAGLIQFIVLSIITCGIYSWIWEYSLANRLAQNAPRYGMTFVETGTTVIMWLIFGSVVCGIGPFIAMHILIKNSNAICAAYNRMNGF